MDDAACPLPVDVDVPERLGYRIKRRLLGPPLVTDQLSEQRLSNPVAFGVLSPDCISSSAYGSEEILIGLLPYAGMAAFALVLPLTGVILGILLLLLFSYRQVLTVYTKAGGSYVVARENFGPRVAQIAAVALLIDYVVTVAVQTAAGTVAVVSAVPALGPYSLALTLGVVALLFYGNLRGIREAGRTFAFPLYFFIAMAALVIVVGVGRELTGHLTVIDPHHLHGVYNIQHGGGFVEGATLIVLLRAFANGGSSLTGFEAISNGVSAFRPPEGRNARRVLLVMACTLAFLVGGVSWLAHATHATPYVSGYPSVISQEARLAFGTGVFGKALFYLMQAASALILYTGANTSFNGFPFLANFVAEDHFLPRRLTRRGHRLVFSNAVLVLTLVASLLLVVTRAKVNALVPFYAIGVFTGFAMAGYGMAKRAARVREGKWRRSVAINLGSGITCTVVVGVFAIAKFTEGAWVVVVVFPLLVWLLIRLNREYREEAEVLGRIDATALTREPNFPRHVVVLLVDDLDLAVLSALRYAQSLKPTELRVVHFALDMAAAERLQRKWERTAQSLPLEIVDIPDRRLGRATLELVSRAVATPGTHATVLLPRRTYPHALGRLLHDRTADKIAAVVSRVPNAAATIVPFDTRSRDGILLDDGPGLAQWMPARAARMFAKLGPAADGANGSSAGASVGGSRPDSATVAAVRGNGSPPNGRNGGVRRRSNGAKPDSGEAPIRERPSGTSAIGGLGLRERAVVHGRLRSVRMQLLGDAPILVCELVDDTGGLQLLFYGRRSIPGLVAGATVTATGRTMSNHGCLAMANPSYRLAPAPVPQHAR